MVIVDVYDLFMVVRAHLKITFKDKDGFNLGSWCLGLGKWMLKHRDHWSVLGWVLYLSSDRYLVLCLSADRYLVLYLCLQRSAAFISRLSTSETDRNPFHIFTHWKSNEMMNRSEWEFFVNHTAFILPKGFWGQGSRWWPTRLSKM